MKWKVELEGNTKGLEQLFESFDDDPRIFEDGGEFYLWSATFDQLDKSGDVKEASEKIVKTVRHLGELDGLRVANLNTSCVVEIQSDGSEKRIVHLSASATVTTTVSARVTVNGEEPPPKAESTYENTQLALEDDKLDGLIELRDQGDHWVNLYRIFEYIRDNIDTEDNIVEQGWWSKSEKDLFTHTANSPEAIGNEARHAKSLGNPPSEPMDHGRAKSLIDDLVGHWLQHRRKVLGSNKGEN